MNLRMRLCNYYKARAYINVSGKDFIEVNKLLLSKLASYNYDNNIQAINPSRLLNSCVGEIISRKPVWIIDIDDLSILSDTDAYNINSFSINSCIKNVNY